VAPTDTVPGIDRPSGQEPSFDELFNSISDVRGWMTRAQAERLWTNARRLPPGARVVEIGSYHGRSAIVLATAAAPGVQVFAIDPHGGNDRGPQQIEGAFEDGQRDHEVFLANLRRTGVLERVQHVRKASQDATEDILGELELVYIDGAHRYEPAMADIVRWGGKVTAGGTLLIHDSFSSVGVTLALMATYFFGSEFRYTGRSGSMAEYRRERLRGVARLRNSLRQLAELPYFLRNVLFKVLLVARLRPVVKALGGTGEWPY
jgi:predicted O-methyltransferase YrrM